MFSLNVKIKGYRGVGKIFSEGEFVEAGN